MAGGTKRLPRAVRLMNHFGGKAKHSVLSAVPDALGARDAIDRKIEVEFPGDAAPALHGRPGMGRYRKLAQYMKKFHLVHLLVSQSHNY